MRILGIETSCDETALTVLSCSGGLENPMFVVEADALFSQAKIHEQYGGVFPALAKREHSKNLIPLFLSIANQCNWQKTEPQLLTNEKRQKISTILEREPVLQKMFLAELPKLSKPPVDFITVTHGPGLEPALWVGISFAKALATLWDIPVMPANHMEGHIFSVLLDSHKKSALSFPLIALLISGGHTELVLVEGWQQYKKLGATRDDAVGEAFDKVARILELPYPGGPEISRLAQYARDHNLPHDFSLPRPMLNSGTYEFSFSGLKTAVLYTTREIKEISQTQKAIIAREFEEATADVLIKKTRHALDEYDAQLLIVGGGVIANSYLRKQFQILTSSLPDTKLLIPKNELATDNAIMIAASSYIKYSAGEIPLSPEKSLSIQAQGILDIAKKAS